MHINKKKKSKDKMTLKGKVIAKWSLFSLQRAERQSFTGVRKELPGAPGSRLMGGMSVNSSHSTVCV